MFETAIIDGDIVNYRCAAATANDDVGLACWQAGEMMQRILHETNSVSYRCFITGSDNFRYSIYPDYKANRRDQPRPKHWAAIREYLVTHWNATVTDGIEADDAMGIEQCAEEGTIICSIDKDMLMIPGWHYNFVKQEMRLVSPTEGMRHFYWQLIMGDRVDNIPGYDGKMRQKVPNFLKPLMQDLEDATTEDSMYMIVFDKYNNEEIMHRNAKCLWIWRKENDLWIPPSERNKGMDTEPIEGVHHFGAESSKPEISPEV